MIAATITLGLICILQAWVIWRIVQNNTESRGNLEQKLIALSNPQAVAAVDAAVGEPKPSRVYYLDEAEELKLQQQQEEDEDLEAS